MKIWKVLYDLDKPSIAVYKNTWKALQKYSTLVQFEALKEKDCSFIKFDHMQSLISTHYLRFVLRKWSTWRLILLRSEQRLYRETCRSLLEDTRREHPGESQRCLYRETFALTLITEFQVFLSTVQKVDTSRKETVKRLIQQFENHPNQDFTLQDFNKIEERKFELHETSLKKQSLQPDQQLRLRQRTGSSTTVGSRTWTGLDSNFFFLVR